MITGISYATARQRVPELDNYLRILFDSPESLTEPEGKTRQTLEAVVPAPNRRAMYLKLWLKIPGNEVCELLGVKCSNTLVYRGLFVLCRHLMDKSSHVDTRQCKKCQYWLSPPYNYCDAAQLTGRTRLTEGCPPPPNCTRFKRRPRHDTGKSL